MANVNLKGRRWKRGGEKKKTSLTINHTTTNAVCCPDKKKTL
jgi:hypothetical protein